MKRFLSIILIVCIMFSISACKENENKENKKSATGEVKNENVTLNLPYNQSDSFNPYTAKTNVNRYLCGLLYDSLTAVNADFTCQNILANSVNISGNTCKVTLKNAVFSDGSAVNAEDITYSFSAAKNSQSRFAANLTSISSAKVYDNKTVIFTLAKHDAYAANLLTFPVFKKGSDKITNSAGISLPPTGSGKYTVNTEKEILEANEKYSFGIPSIKTIRLINAAGEEALSHIVDIGAVDVYYTSLDDCKILRMQGKRKNMVLNNLVFLGFNLKNNICKNTNFRQAVSAALSRDKICEDAYFTNAVSATGIFHPNWSEVSSIQSIANTANTDISIENLNQIGYNITSDSRYAVNSAGQELSVNLLVNKENQFRCKAADLIVTQLSAVGIKVNLESVPFAQYKSRLENGQFEMYLAESNILNNMDVSQLLCSGGSMAFGIPKKSDKKKSEEDKDNKKTESDNETETESSLSEIESKEKENISSITLQSVISGFYSGKNTIADIASLSMSEMPIVPVCYRTGILFTSKKITDCSASNEGNIYAFIK